VGGGAQYNKHYLDYLGLSPDDMAGDGWMRQIHPDDLGALLGAWNAAVVARSPAEAEARLRRHDGEYRWFLFRVHPLVDERRRIVQWYGVNTDIQDRKQAEEARDRAQAELAYAARVMSLGVLTASIAHEVSQPLSGILTNANTCLRLLAADPSNLDGVADTARRTVRDANRAAEVIGHLRALFSKRAPAFEPVDINEASREVVALSASELQRRRVSVRTDLSETLPPVRGDRIQLQQVILNLLINGSDAMADVEDRPRSLLLETALEGNSEIRLSVRDAGVGIEPETAEKLFEAFYTTKESGMGVGLSISRSIVESHGGRLWAVANEGPGATFSFSIPCDRPD
jgi:hypothetical protein